MSACGSDESVSQEGSASDGSSSYCGSSDDYSDESPPPLLTEGECHTIVYEFGGSKIRLLLLIST